MQTGFSKIPSNLPTPSAHQASFPISKSTSDTPLPNDTVIIAQNPSDSPMKLDSTPGTSSTLTAQDTTGKPERVKVRIFPQDPLMDPPLTTEVDPSVMGKKLSNQRVRIEDRNFPIAIPDLEGNYLFEPLDPHFNQVNTLVLITHGVNTMENFCGHKIPWSFGDEQITVIPHAREGANAYYARWEGAITLMHFRSEALDKTVQTAQSADINFHELGHALLDGLRPKFISSWSAETRAFHESFADSTAMLLTLSLDENIEALINETGGDLSKNNRLSMLAEEFGKAIKLKDNDPTNDDQMYLRNAINSFKYAPPETLPNEGPRDTLTNQPHSFSRIFTGAFYDLLQRNFDSHLSRRNDGSMKEAFKTTRDHLGTLLLKAVDLSADSGATFKSLALNMIQADNMLFNGLNRQDLVEIFKDRKILTDRDIKDYEDQLEELPDIKLEGPIQTEGAALDFLKKHDRDLNISADTFKKAQVVTDSYGNTILQFTATQEVKLQDHNIDRVADITHDLYADVHGGLTLCFDKNGELISVVRDMITPRKVEETIAALTEADSAGMIRRQPLYKTDNLFRDGSIPYQGEVYQEPGGKFKVQRIPMIT